MGYGYTRFAKLGKSAARFLPYAIGGLGAYYQGRTAGAKSFKKPPSRTKTKLRRRRRRRRKFKNFRKGHGTSYEKHVVQWRPKIGYNILKSLQPVTYQYSLANNLTLTYPNNSGFNSGAQIYSSPMIPILTPRLIKDFTDVATTGQRRDIFIKSQKTRVMFTNATTANCVVSLYAFYAKRDLENDDATNTPFGHWGEGLNNMAGANGFYHNSSSPLLSKKCRDFWGVEKKWVWTLQGGETITVDYIFNANKKINGQLIGELASDASVLAGSLKGVTRYLGLVVHGTPVENDVVANAITTSPFQICWTADAEITSSTMNISQATMGSVSSQLTNIVAQKNVQPGDQEVATVVVP